MQKSLLDARCRQELVNRLDRLTPESTARWGKMTALQMLAHLADWMLMAKGDLDAAPRKSVLRFPLIKQLAVYWLPFPRNVQTSPELLSRKPSDWTAERAAVRRHVQSFENLDPNLPWPHHPVFGKLTPAAWCVFAYRHMDHHLRQFGI